jgi:MFS transporter, Spinster family, sphingosine-1-phosphate transporter
MAAMKRLSDAAAERLTFLVLLASLLTVFADQSLLGPFLNPLLLDFFGTTANVVPLGWVGFVTILLSAVSMVVSGILSDRGARLRVCAAGTVLCGAAAAACWALPHGRPGFLPFFLLRALAGVGAGALVPAVFSLAADLIPPRRRGTAFGVLSVAMLVGRLGGFALAAAFDTRWRTAFGLLGLVNIAFGVLAALPREPRRGGREEELQEAVRHGAEYRFRITLKDIRLLARARSNVWLLLNVFDAVPGAIIGFLIFKYMKEIHNLETAAVDFLLLAVFVAGAAGAVLFGRLGDWGYARDKRAKVLTAMACNVVPIGFMVAFLTSRAWAPAGASLGATLAAPGMAALVLTVAAAMFVNQGVNPNWYGTLTDINLPEHRATMISLASVKDQAANALGPLVGSYFATIWGLKTAMASVLVFWVLNILFWTPVLRHVRKDIGHAHQILSERAKTLIGAAAAANGDTHE